MFDADSNELSCVQEAAASQQQQQQQVSRSKSQSQRHNEEEKKEQARAQTSHAAARPAPRLPDVGSLRGGHLTNGALASDDIFASVGR